MPVYRVDQMCQVSGGEWSAYMWANQSSGTGILGTCWYAATIVRRLAHVATERCAWVPRLMPTPWIIGVSSGLAALSMSLIQPLLQRLQTRLAMWPKRERDWCVVPDSIIPSDSVVRVWVYGATPFRGSSARTSASHSGKTCSRETGVEPQNMQARLAKGIPD